MTAPLPPEIYRRRRVAAVVILVVLLLLIAWVVKAITGGSGAEEKPENVAASEKVTVSREDGSEVTSKPEEEKPSEPYPSTSKEPEAKDSCEAADLVLTVKGDSPNYGAEDKPEFSLTLENPTKADCKVNLDESTLRFEVFDLADYKRVWSDLDCHDSEGAGEETIKAGEKATFNVKWSRLSSAPGKCSEADRQQVGAGNYIVYGLLGDRNSDPYTFNLG
ncbi:MULTISPECIES: hypothetical protein [unclassified Corynebacterium]|uniref:hypothetical protein n=1 Tax=unclassified Corynebacterium TaxID=2624378 RepID=UPI003098080C